VARSIAQHTSSSWKMPALDWSFVLGLWAIPCLSLVVLFSAGHDANSAGLTIPWPAITIQSQAFLKQVIFLAAGFCVFVGAALIPTRWMYRLAYPMYIICVLMLVGVLLFGTIANGSQRWFSLGPLKFQPSEIMKLATVLTMARLLSCYPHEGQGYRLKQLWWPGVVLMIPAALILKQPDLGTGLAVAGIGGAMIFFVGVHWRALLLLVGGGVGMLFPAWQWVLKPYQRRRILTLFNPDDDPLGSGYHIIQSKIAVGSGSVFGKGFMKGTQTQLEFLPEHTTDFVFSVLAEEWGFFGCAVVLSLYLFCLYRIIHFVAKKKDLFSALVILGIGAMLFFHVLVNIGMVIGILPVVGIPLPLFSYGGSSVLSFMLALGLVLGLSSRKDGVGKKSAWR
jgi:rod shape determining protein RodA